MSAKLTVTSHSCHKLRVTPPLL